MNPAPFAVTFIDVTAPLPFVITFAVALPPLVDDITTVSELDKPNPALVTWILAIEVVAGYTSNISPLEYCVVVSSEFK